MAPALIKLLGILCFTFSFTVCHSQTIKGRIVNKSGSGISYATTGYCGHTAVTVSDSLGFFIIKKIPGDSIRVNAIGYSSMTIPVSDTLQYISIILNEKIKDLEGVNIESRKKTNFKTTLGFYNKIDNYLFRGLGFGEQAVFIENKNQVRGYIDQIKFRLDDFRGLPFALRMRLYDIDSATGLPNEDLLFEQNYIEPGDFKKVNVLNIKEQNVKLPPAGVFVSFQWIILKPELQGKVHTPVIVGHNQVSRSYLFERGTGLKWRYKPERSSAGYLPGNGYWVPAISIVVSY
jgi:hypothetical protein